MVSAQPTGNHQDKTVVSYDGAKGYPYVATMQNAASSWLIYNRHNPTATQNEFTLEFTNTSSGWSGAHETNTSTKNNASSTTSRRIMW
ncbi:MAG: hypothetical protein IE916_11870 [Epsilonproteobacteria bacterium]|nr:hypothetical protein [Campylobacterota bacterium]